MLAERRRQCLWDQRGRVYPLRMAWLGWLKVRADPRGRKRTRRDYVLTAKGRAVMTVVRAQVRELHNELAS